VDLICDFFRFPECRGERGICRPGFPKLNGFGGVAERDHHHFATLAPVNIGGGGQDNGGLADLYLRWAGGRRFRQTWARSFHGTRSLGLGSVGN